MQPTMKAKNLMGIFATVLAFVFVMPAVSAFASFEYVEIDSMALYNGESMGVTAGQELDLNVIYTGTSFGNDARITARILGEPGISDNTERFDVFGDGVPHSETLSLTVPSDIEPNEFFLLEITLENSDGEAFSVQLGLMAQRENYALNILSVNSDSNVNAGEALPLDVVVKNIGLDLAEDVFVEARILELGISQRIFLDDLFPIDNLNNDEFDTANERVWLNMPSNAAAGLYTIEIEAFSDDASTIVTKNVQVLGANVNSNIITSIMSKDFTVGQNGMYSFTIVNSGSSIEVYTLITDVEDGFNVDLDESVIAVPAGSSKTVKLTATADREGTYNFVVNVHGADGELIGTQSFEANVEEGKAVSGNAAVVLTIVLAIIFVVLLIVLIVLLTRKPETSEEFGESYY